MKKFFPRVIFFVFMWSFLPISVIANVPTTEISDALPAGSVVIGDGSKVYEEYVVSVGDGKDPNFGTRRIINVKNPEKPQDAATKHYVDSKLPVITQEIGDSDTAVMSQKSVSELLNAHKICDIIYPVDSIYLSINPTNPGLFFGGTWERWGQGRVPVGLDETNSKEEFKKVESKFGEPSHVLALDEMPEHDGHIPDKQFSTSSTNEDTYALVFNDHAAIKWSTDRPYVLRADNELCLRSHKEGSSHPVSLYQPSITCFMWKRLA